MNVEKFQIIAEKLSPQLLRVARKSAIGMDDAEDLVQETLMQLWMARERIEKYDNLEAVAVKTLRNKIIDRFRKPKLLLEEIESQPLASWEKDVLQKMEERDDAQRLLRIIQQLPELQKMIMILKDVEGYETEEIAKITHSSQENIRVNLSRARKKVREQFLKEI